MYIMYVLYATIQITNPPASRPNRIATPWWPRRWPPRWGSPAMKPQSGVQTKNMFGDTRNVMILNCFRPNFETILNLNCYCYSNWPLPG